MWLLKSDGSFGAMDAPAEVEIPGDAAIDRVPVAHSIAVLFGGTADGRGFSVARQLRARGYGGTLIATGPLIPDQARHAFQSGFDAIAITDERLERHGEGAWRDAAAVAVRELYVADTTSRGAERGIWALRHAS
ncbi:MAG: DUF934 domain-containing protein [Pseudomonadota bacterium]